MVFGICVQKKGTDHLPLQFLLLILIKLKKYSFNINSLLSLHFRIPLSGMILYESGDCYPKVK